MSGKFSCHLCAEIFNNESDLQQQLNFVHGQVSQKIQCPKCGRAFSRKDHLKAHESTCWKRATIVNISLRLLLTNVANTAKLFSFLISYFKDSLQRFFGHHTTPTVAKRSVTFKANTPLVPQLVTDCVANGHAQTCQCLIL